MEVATKTFVDYVFIPVELFYDFLYSFVETILGSEGNTVPFEAIPRDYNSLLTDVLVIIINLVILIVLAILYKKANPQRGMNFFVSANLLMSLGLVMLFLGVVRCGMISSNPGTAIRDAIIFFACGIPILIYCIKEIKKERGIAVLIVMIIASVIFQETIWVLITYILILRDVFSIVIMILGFIICLVAVLYLLGAFEKIEPVDPNESYDSDDDDDDDDDYELDSVYYDKHGRIYTTDSRGRVYGPDGKIVKTYKGSDGDIYIGDKYSPRLYDHPDDKLW